MAVRARVSGALISFASISVLCAMGPSASLVGALTGGDEDVTDYATTSGSSSSEEQCTWYVVGVPSSISMVSEGGAPYRGDELAVADASAEALRVYASGNATGGRRAGTDTFVQCTAYGEITRPKLSVSLAERLDEGNGVFVASYGAENTPDEALNFSVMDSAVNFDVTPDEACYSPTAPSAWSHVDATFDGATGWTGGGSSTSDAETVMEIANILNVTSPVNDVDDDNEPDYVDSDETDNCGFTWTIGTTLPGERTPAGFGSAYTWAGPTVRFALATPGS